MTDANNLDLQPAVVAGGRGCFGVDALMPTVGRCPLGTRLRSRIAMAMRPGSVSARPAGRPPVLACSASGLPGEQHIPAPRPAPARLRHRHGHRRRTTASQKGASRHDLAIVALMLALSIGSIGTALRLVLARSHTGPVSNQSVPAPVEDIAEVRESWTGCPPVSAIRGSCRSIASTDVSNLAPLQSSERFWCGRRCRRRRGPESALGGQVPQDSEHPSVVLSRDREV